MKKILSLIVAAVLCLLLSCPVFAAESAFVPSIGYKDSLEIGSADLKGDDLKDCLEVTSVIEAKEKSTDISQEERDLLLKVYEDLLGGKMDPPCDEEKYVIRDLVHLGFSQSGCISQGHTHKEFLAQDGNTVTVTFKSAVSSGEKVTVMCYMDGQWVEAEKVTNNGDGTVTVVLEDIGVLAFCVERGPGDAPQTGDPMGRNLMLWVTLMVVSLAAMAALVVGRRRMTQ